MTREAGRDYCVISVDYFCSAKLQNTVLNILHVLSPTPPLVGVGISTFDFAFCIMHPLPPFQQWGKQHTPQPILLKFALDLHSPLPPSTNTHLYRHSFLDRSYICYPFGLLIYELSFFVFFTIQQFLYIRGINPLMVLHKHLLWACHLFVILYWQIWLITKYLIACIATVNSIFSF